LGVAKCGVAGSLPRGLASFSLSGTNSMGDVLTKHRSIIGCSTSFGAAFFSGSIDSVGADNHFSVVAVCYLISVLDRQIVNG
jgi:hypothetical protein